LYAPPRPQDFQQRSRIEALLADGASPLVAPAAVRMVDLDARFTDLQLSRAHGGTPYQTLLAVARLNGDPLGTCTISIDETGWVSRRRLARELRRRFEPELREAYARRDLDLPASLPRAGVPSEPRTPYPASTPPPVRVVVATCSDPVALERCLHSIFACDYGDFEVIVVENRPASPATRQMLSERFADEANLRYVEQPRRGASWARNTGLALAAGDIVAFTDDDVVVDPAWIGRCAGAFERAPDVACVTGLILPLELETDSQVLLEEFAGFGKGFDGQVWRLPEARDENPLLPYTPGTIGSGANTVVRADVARRIGGFDTTLGPGTPSTGAEDLDLYTRLLREGCAVAYEPSAIVWHEHPEGMPRLRRQVYSYGVGLGALLGKQLVRGPERLELLRAVPGGIRYARDPTSRKNAGKSTGYPRRLEWLERLGMLIGPAAYLLSMVVAAIRRLAHLRSKPALAFRAPVVERLILPHGPVVEVVSFEERETDWAPSREIRKASGQRESSPTEALAIAVATAACIVAPPSVALGLPTALRLPAVLTLLCLAPGTALCAVLRGRFEWGLALGASLGATGVLAQSMLWLDAWWPRAFLYALAAACLPPLVSHLSFPWPRRPAASPRRSGPSPALALVTAPPAWDRPSTSLRLMRVRSALASMPRSLVLHATLLSLALAAWAISLLGTHLSRIDGFGLLSALGPTYFLAFALLLVGFAVAVTREKPAPVLLGTYVLALVLVLHGTAPLLYDEPRYAWLYKHLGVIQLIAGTGQVDRQIDIYNNWPAFFAANAWISRTTGVAAIAYAGWAQLFFNVANVLAVRFALRGLTRDERLLWTASLFFVLGNWVGQDYLAPQAFGFLLTVVVLGLCLRCSPMTARPSRAGRWLAPRLARVTRGLVPARAPAEDLPPAPLGPGAALIIGGLCFLAVVTSHQLSPALLILSVAALWLAARRLPRWVPLVMLALELWWVGLAWLFVKAHFSLIDPGAAGAPASGRDLHAALPGAALGFYAPAAVVGLTVMLALWGATRRLRAGKRDLVPAGLIVAPLLGAGLQSYGGEGVNRAYLFALPWLAFFAAAACARSFRGRGPVRMRFSVVTVAGAAVGACLLFAYFGQELANRITPDDVRAAAWYERHAPPGSIRINLAPNAPDRLTARYPLVSLDDRTALVEGPGFRGRRLGAADVPALVRLLEPLTPPHPTFLVLSRGQENYARLNGLLPKGSASSLAQALAASPAFRLVYRRPTAWIFQYVPHAPR
jgi:GT2 family glycosyltransferase